MNWKHYDYPVYWSLPDDGATIKCADCNKDFKCKDVILTQTPNDKRAVLCMNCVCDDWLASAKNLGRFPD